MTIKHHELLMGAAGGPTIVTFDPTFVGANWVLSGGNLIGTNTSTPSLGSNGNLRSTVTKTGAFYFEARLTTIPSGQQLQVGIGTSAHVQNSKLGYDAFSVAFDNLGLFTFGSGSSTAFGAALAVNDVVGIAYDTTTGKFWASVNNVWRNSGDPAAGTGNLGTGPTGAVYAMAGVDVFNRNAALTIRFDSATFSGTIPTGFVAFQ